MKRILASLFATSVAICSAAAANAQIGQDTSIHTGNVTPACTIVATGADLTGNTTTLPTSISSTGGTGKFTTKCNSTHTLKVELLIGDSPTPFSGATYKEEFKLTSAAAGYTDISRDFGSAEVSQASLPATSTNGYVVAVEAKGSITPGFYLPAGTYKINVRATATPN